MSVDTSLLSFLSSHLLVQKKPITYRLLSREKNLHVSVAREALEKFHKENAGKELKATYVLQGTDADSGEGHILLVGEDRLEETKATFDQSTLCIQYYSLSPSSPKSKSLTTSDLAFFSTVPLTLSSDKSYTTAWQQADRGKDFGAIYNANVKQGDPRALQAAQEQAAAQAKLQEQKAKEAEKEVKKEAQGGGGGGGSAASTSTSKAKTGTNNNEKKKDSVSPEKSKAKGGLDWGKAKSKSAAVEKPTPAAKKGKAVVSSKKSVEVEDSDADADQSDVEMADIGYADSDQEVEEKPAGSSKMKRADGVQSPPTTFTNNKTDSTAAKGKGGKSEAEREEQRRKLREMMDVEESQDGPGEAVPDVSSKAEASTSTMKGNEDDVGGDSDVEMTDAPAAPTRRKVRRQKRTVRKERTTDAKGYKVTKEVSDYESYSDWTESEEAPAAKKGKPAAATKKASSSKAQQAHTTKPKKPPAASEKRSATPTGVNEKSASPPKQPPAGANKKSGTGGGGGGGGGGGAGGQSKLSSFFKKG